MGQYYDPNPVGTMKERKTQTNFLNLEKKRYFNNKNNLTLTNNHGGVIYKDSDILREAKSFYQNYILQVSQHLRTHEDTFFPKGNALLLNPLEQGQCEGLPTETECLAGKPQIYGEEHKSWH